MGTIVAILWLGDTSLCINFAADVFPDFPLLSTWFLRAVLILSVKIWYLGIFCWFSVSVVILCPRGSSCAHPF